MVGGEFNPDDINLGGDGGGGGPGGNGGQGGNGDIDIEDDTVDPNIPVGMLIEHYHCNPMAIFNFQNLLGCDCREGAMVTQDSLLSNCRDKWAAESSGLMDGSLQFNAAIARKCLSLVTETTGKCQKTNDAIMQGVCGRIVSDKSGQGEPCAYRFCDGGNGLCVGGQCSPMPEENNFCSEACKGDSFCINAQCSKQVGEGEACFDNMQCPGKTRCVNGFCRELTPDGVACSLSQQCEAGSSCTPGLGCIKVTGSPCQTAQTCGNLSYCDIEDTKICQAPKGNGEVCLNSDECEQSLYCLASATGNMCVQRPTMGQPCGGPTRECAPGFICSMDQATVNTCVPLPNMGQTCAQVPGGGFSGCAQGLGCIMGNCSPLPTAGTRCTDDQRCADSATCVTGQCVAKMPAGQPCGTGDDNLCMAGNYCAPNRVCVPYLGMGEQCLPNSTQCGPNGVCSENGVCVAMPGLGQKCTTRCQAGLRCDFTGRAATCQPSICSIISN